MSRKPRVYIPGIPCHVIQRGNNRNACFFSEKDYRFYLDCLQDACSSYSANAYGKTAELITPHPLYLQLGKTANVRQENYRELFSSSLGIDEIHAIQTAGQFSTPLGNKRFKAQIEKATGQKIGQAKRSRPLRKQSDRMANEN